MTTTVVQVRKKVEDLKQRLHVREPHYSRGTVWTGKDGGPYGHSKVRWDSRGFHLEPLTEEEEVNGLRQFYEDVVPKHAKRVHEATEHSKEFSWETFEGFLKYSRGE